MDEEDFKKLFLKIKEVSYKTAGDSVDYRIHINFNEKTIRLLFQESVGKRDWLNNFNFPVKIYKNQKSCLKAHRGFGNAYKSANDEIMTELQDYMQKYLDFEVVIAGWSHGGALAVLAAEDFYFRFKKQAMLITYGAPKTLWGKKSQEYLRTCVKDAVQFGNNNDIVTYLPPFPGYHHVNIHRCGEKFSLKKIFRADVYHCNYGEIDLI